jgi:hypothetical protein
VDLTETDGERAFRAECRAWLTEHVPSGPLPSGDTRDGFARHLEWERELYDAGWAVVSWPAEYGGRDATLMEWLVFEEEYWAAGAPPRVTQNGIFLLAPTLLEFGTAEQKARYLPPMGRGDETWCQGWSEPGAGSDLAAITSRADRVDGGWKVTGQKTWTTRGAFCDWLFGLFRTDPDADKPHRGMTYLMVPLTAAGVTVRGFERLDGDEGFAEVFFEDVFVPDDQVIGDVNQGWYVAMATTTSERGLTLRSPGRFTASSADLVAAYRKWAGFPRDLRPRQPDARLRDRVARAVVDTEAYRLYVLQTATTMAEGGDVGAESSLNKLFWSEMDVRLHEVALDLLGPGAETDVDGWMKGFQFALAGPIYAGTNEIQRNVVAERVLGLPRG